MNSSHPLHHNLKVGFGGLERERQLWYEFHIECVMRKLYSIDKDRPIYESAFVQEQFKRIATVVTADRVFESNTVDEKSDKPMSCQKKEYVFSNDDDLDALMDDLLRNIADQSTAELFESAVTGLDVHFNHENIAHRFEFSVLPLWIDAVSEKLPAIDQAMRKILQYSTFVELKPCPNA